MKLLETVKTYQDADCLEYDIIIDNKKVAYAVEYVDDSAEIYYDFATEDVNFEDPLSSYAFDSNEELQDFIYNQFENAYIIV